MLKIRLRVVPKPFDAVKMIPWLSPTHKIFRRVDRMMFVIPFQGLRALKRVDGLDGPMPGFSLDMPFEFLDTPGLSDFGAYGEFPLQESKDNTFPVSRSAWLPPPSRSEGGLVLLNLAFQISLFQLNQREQGVPHSMKDVVDLFDIETQIPSQPIGGLELIGSLQDGQQSAQSTQTFDLTVEQTFQMSSASVKNLKRATKQKLGTLPIVGRTTKNHSSSSIPEPVLADTGYETPYKFISKGFEEP